ncbi:TM0106 family RecB-like putative nuclease [Arthrobacter citreus]|uniref:TM0106 family RecB-like putative nuclease n=1 Tax=Arthrobacter citreus TaxID=1670 RepID=UPI003825E9EB
MFLIDSAEEPGTRDLVYSASDLVTAATCEYQVLRKLDEKLGWRDRAVFDADSLLAQAAALGDVHEHRVLEEFRSEFGPWTPGLAGGVCEITEATSMDRWTLEAKHTESITALLSGADVVFQAAFFDGTFHGRSDFLIREGHSYAVYDTKLARHAKTPALLQLAAYADQLEAAGIRPASEAVLILGNNVRTRHRVADIVPVFRERRGRFLDLTATHRSGGEPAHFNAPGILSCGRCDYCQEEVERTRDLLLVGGMSTIRRKQLRDAGIRTIDDLAGLTDGQAPGALRRLRDQARMQTGAGPADGSVTFEKDGAAKTLTYRVLSANTLDRLPEPNPGDIFFDFEGDPLWQDPVSGSWGLEYLFGVVENPAGEDSKALFKPFWAHSRAEEGTAFHAFLAYVQERRRQYPGMHVYHYANYEKAALRRLSLTHVVGEDAVDTLLRENVLIDLYDVVRSSLLISDKSYSIKKLEPLYMGRNLRSGDVTDAGASVVAYAQYCEARDAGDATKAQDLLAGIADYNEYDCLSTLELRNWLLKLAADHGRAPRTRPIPQDRPEPEPPSTEERRLLEYLERQAGAPTSDGQAVALIAAATGYHRREDKQFWWGHFDRLNAPAEKWDKTRDVLVAEEVQLVQNWERPTPRSSPARVIRLIGSLAAGSSLKEGDNGLCLIYEQPFPEHLRLNDGGANLRAPVFQGTILSIDTDRDRTVLTVSERLPKGAEEFNDLPLALAPKRPIDTASIKQALSELAHSTGATLPALPRHPGVDILRRIPPRLTGSEGLPPVVEHDYAAAITAAVERLDDSYLAVQGPPGTGKTHVGSHVIASLVRSGWKVGVVAQSHAVVENILIAAIDKAGLDPDLVAKEPKAKDTPWTGRTKTALEQQLSSPGGCLIGGTTWTMTGKHVPAGSLDLLVIDEAGQFSLANTLAVSRSARRILLLGDPQQLPQVTQAIHPEPVDTSALGWLSAGHATLPGKYGYFLADSWRMHPELCRAVSDLAYDSKLDSAPAAGERHLAGEPAGVECVLVDHQNNSTLSAEEAQEVVRQVRRHLGLIWTTKDEPARALEEGDILAVAAYNAQVDLIRQELESAGHRGVRVGTVDRFQGQEAPVVIVSMACSAPEEAPRGMGFLLNRNRINVAVSRGKWRAVVVRSTRLTHYMPSRPEALEELGAFIGLCATTDNGRIR